MSDNDRARKVVIASFLGWMLDAFDFFLMVFVFSDIAKEFGVSITTVTVAVTLTLAMRALGAFIFGRLADHFGRRPMLMISVLCYSVLELLSGLAPTLLTFLISHRPQRVGVLAHMAALDNGNGVSQCS